MPNFYEGGAAMFDAIVYARPHENTIQFLQNHNQQFYQGLNDAGRQFMDAARSFYDQMGLTYGTRQLEALSRTVEGMWQSDSIRELKSLDELQNAPPAMRRWIMAQPDLRKLYHQQRVDGYINQYVDYFPNDVGEAHYDYRRATNGVVMENDDGSWHARTHFEELLPGDQPLTKLERADIQGTWEYVLAVLTTGQDDPTSLEGNDRG